MIVYRVAEPALSTATRKFTKNRPGSTEPAEAIRLRYPDGKHDAETLLVHPRTGNIYIVTKVVIANPVVYEAVGAVYRGKSITMTTNRRASRAESIRRRDHGRQHLS